MAAPSSRAINPWRPPWRIRRALGFLGAFLLVTTTLVTTPVLGTRPAHASTGSTTSRPNADGTTTSWTQGGSCAGGFWDCIDDDPDSPDDTNYVQGPNRTNSQMFVQLTDMPSDFGYATAVSVKARQEENGAGGNDTITSYYQVYQSDESTAITAETSGTLLTDSAYTTDTYSMSITGTNSKSNWDGARIRIRQVYAQVTSADATSQGRFSAVEVNMTYFSTSTAKLTQKGFIFENDDEDQTSGDAVDENTQQAAGNTAITNVKKGERLTLRMQIDNTGGASLGSNLGLFYDRNDGEWTKVRSATAPVTGAGTCADTNFNCTTVESTNTIGLYTSMALDPSGNPWVSYQDSTNLDLRVAKYVGSGGSGCASSAWSCTAVETTNDVGQSTSIAFDPSGSAWVAYLDNTNGDLRVAQYVGSGGTGCASTAWTCTAVDTTNNTGWFPSISFDASGSAWVSYYDSTAGDLRVAKYVGSGGTGCAVTTWTCTTVDSTNTVGQFTSIAFDPTGNAWVSYYDATNFDLRVANYVGSGGTGCASTAWTCTAVDTPNTVGQFSSIAFDPSGNAWVSYYDVTNGDLRVANYVGSGGTGCTSSAWTCTAVETTNDVGKYNSIAFDPSGNAWVTYYDATNLDLRLARYTGSGGTGCASSAWTCSAVDTPNDVGKYSSIAFDPSGNARVSYYDATNGDLRVANLNRAGEITTTAGLAGASGDPLNESHVDMTSVTDTTNRDDADCLTAGATWNNGKWFESEEASGLSLPAGNVTTQCTEIAFTIDTSQATPGATYRFAIASDDNWRTDKGPWRGPISIVNYPSLTIESATIVRDSKDAMPDMPNCAGDAAWACAAIDTANATGYYTSMAFDPSGTAWISSYENTNHDLRVAKYVGSGGTGCATTAWTCTAVDTANDYGAFSSIAIDPSGNPWVSYLDLTNFDLRVAQYVGSGGTGCAVTSWTCVTVDSTNSPGYYTSIAFDAAGSAWVSEYDNSALDLRVAHYVGSGGTGCAVTTWTCWGVDTTNNVGAYNSIAIDPYGNPWVSYIDTTNGDMKVARYVGTGGTGCAVTAWTCTSVDTTNAVGYYSSIAFDPSGNAWVSYYDNTNFDLRVAKYVGSGGTGCAVTTWTCTAVDSTNSMGQLTSIAFDSAGNAWVSYYDVTNTDLKVARYVGSGGTGCALTTWTCTAVDTSANTIGQYTHIAFDPSGTPWVSSCDATNGDLRVAKMHLPPVQPSYTDKYPYPKKNGVHGDARYHLDLGDTSRPVSGACDATSPNKGYCGVLGSDSDSDSMSAQANEVPIYVAAKRDSANTTLPNFTWIGQSTVAPSSDAISVQVWNSSTLAWVTPGTVTNGCSSTGANTACTITAVATGTASNYWEADGSNYWAYYRVYQAYNGAGAETLKTDVLSVMNHPPSAPTSLAQYKSDGTTSIATGGWTNETSVVLKGTVSDPDSDVTALCAEVAASLTSPASPTPCGSTVTSGTTASVTPTGLVSGTTYKWQAKAKDAITTYSTTYTQFNAGGAAFTVDAVAPVTGTVYDGSAAGVESLYNNGSMTTLSCNWSGFSDPLSGLAGYSYSLGTTVGGTDLVGWTSVGTGTTSFTANSLTLQTSVRYYCNVKASDVAGNVTSVISSPGQLVAPSLTFSTSTNALAFAALNAGNGYTDTKTMTLTTSTDAYNGYIITAYEAHALSYGANTIADYASPASAPTTWSGNGFGYTISGGSAVAAFSGSKYAHFGASGSPDTPVAHSGPIAGSPISSEQETVGFKIATPATQIAGSYSTVLVWSCVASY